jgi:transglycosylase-like protein with SLT domain/sporulation related protein
LLCATIRSAATEAGLPVGYFARVIWQESRLRPDALGPITRTGARAQGIAQFMPATAAERVVLNPFDPAEALPKSAALLQQLRAEFGNLGLAAATYNAGPQRVRSWFAGRRPLPSETLAYARSITGRAAEEWKKPGADDSNLAIPADTPCTETAGVSAKIAFSDAVAQSKSAAAWVVQLVGDRSASDALASYDRLRKKHPAILEPYEPVLVRTTTGASAAAVWHRVRVVANSRQAAETLCSRLRAEGGSCLVQHN